MKKVSRQNGATQRILSALEFGPMTCSELREELGGYERTAMATLLRGLLKPNSKYPKRIHIIGWRQDHFGQRNYPRPIYDLGDGIDVPRPTRNRRIQQAKSKKKYLARIKTLRMTNSVFNLGAGL